MIEQLYIDDHPVDMPEKKSITLNFKSNLLGDISKITASNSYTIELPKTARNRRILDNPGSLAYDSTFPYKYHTARYYRNGIDIIGEATAVILESADNYQIALTWGVLQGLKDWIAAAPTLRDLSDAGDNLPWNENSTPSAYPPISNDYFYASYNLGVELTNDLKKQVNIHPVVSVKWLLEKIQAENNFTLDIVSPQKEAIDNLVIPLLDKDGKDILYTHLLMGEIDLVPKSYWYAPSLNSVWLFYIEPSSADASIWDQTTHQYIADNNNGNIRIQINDGVSPITIKCLYPLNPILIIQDNNYEGQVLASFDASSSIIEDGWYLYSYTINGTYKAPPSGRFVIRFAHKHVYFQTYIQLATPEIKNALTYGEYRDKVEYPTNTYPIIPNLPDIKQVDFIKALCAMFGLFAVSVPGDDKTIRLVSVDMLVYSKSDALDWSRKLIDSEYGESKSLTYKFSDYAQNNKLEYKEDDTVTGDYNGAIVINDQTLTKDKTILTLPFAASDGDTIPIYTLEDGEIKENKVQPRIMNLINSEGVCTLSFNGLSFKNLISEYYDIYQRLLAKPKTVKDRFTLSDLDLKQLDFTKPIYVEQYGRYFGVVSVQTNSDGICDTELLPLPFTDIDDLEANTISIDEEWSDTSDPGTRRFRVKALYAVASVITVVVSAYAVEDVVPFDITLTIPQNSTVSDFVSAIPIEITSITPVADSRYKYVKTFN